MGPTRNTVLGAASGIFFLLIPFGAIGAVPGGSTATEAITEPASEVLDSSTDAESEQPAVESRILTVAEATEIVSIAINGGDTTTGCARIRLALNDDKYAVRSQSDINLRVALQSAVATFAADLNESPLDPTNASELAIRFAMSLTSLLSAIPVNGAPEVERRRDDMLRWLDGQVQSALQPIETLSRMPIEFGENLLSALAPATAVVREFVATFKVALDGSLEKLRSIGSTLGDGVVTSAGPAENPGFEPARNFVQELMQNSYYWGCEAERWRADRTVFNIFAHCSPDPTLFDSLQSAAPETFEVILQIDFAQGIFLHVSTKSIDDRWLPRQSVSLADLGASYNQVIGYALARGIIPASRLSQFEQFTGCLQPRQALPSMTLIFTTPAAGSLAAPSFFDQRLLGIDVPVIQVETNDEDEETYYTLQDIYESDGASGSRSFADAYFDTVSRWARANQ